MKGYSKSPDETRRKRSESMRGKNTRRCPPECSCGKHSSTPRSTKQKPVARVQLPDSHWVCSVLDCDNPKLAKGLCNKHYIRMRKHDSLDDPPPPKGRKPLPYGKQEHLPEWDRHYTTSGYLSFHRKIAKERGKASEFPCVDCGQQARDWSHQSGEFRGDIMSYFPRCRSCHIGHDNPQSGEGNNSAKLTWNVVDRIRKLHSQGVRQIEISEQLGVSPGNVSRIVLGKRWSGER